MTHITADINNRDDGWVQVTLSGDDVQDLTERHIEWALNAELVGWQPIDTAPKDGTAILLGGCTWGPNVRVGSWGKARFNRSTRDYDPDWCSGSDQGGFNPTHWMPLPQEPGT